MTPEHLLSFEVPGKKSAGGTYVRMLVAVKLLLFAALLPILLTPVIDTSALEPLLESIVALTIMAFISVAISILFIGFLPFLEPFWWKGWEVLCFFVGLLLEITIVAPRIFLGSVLDLLLFEKRNKYVPVLFSPWTTLLLAVVFLATVFMSSHLWFASYHAELYTTENLRPLPENWYSW